MKRKDEELILLNSLKDFGVIGFPYNEEAIEAVKCGLKEIRVRKFDEHSQKKRAYKAKSKRTFKKLKAENRELYEKYEQIKNILGANQ